MILILVGGWWYFRQAPVPAPAAPDMAAAPEEAGANAMDGAPASTSAMQATGPTVHYTATGFDPEEVTIDAGQKVTFVNDTSSRMWVASDEHPTHTGFDGSDRETHCSGAYTGPTPFDQCQSGSTYTFVFTEAGTFPFHNHAASEHTGVVTVQ
jgi:plastocyanin